ncbi:hypothetical protein ACT453_26680, partial [Bacillus sp. D-CC]
EKIIPKQNLETMKRKQFVRYVDAHIREMMKLGEIFSALLLILATQLGSCTALTHRMSSGRDHSYLVLK